MTRRYVQKRLAMLLSAVQVPFAARVIEWPQKVHHPEKQRGRPVVTDKSSREGNDASK